MPPSPRDWFDASTGNSTTAEHGIARYNKPMSLTSEDLDQVRGVVVDVVTTAIQELVLPRFDEHDKRFEKLESDMTEVKEDVRILKEDVRVLKDDVRILKDDVHILKEDMREAKDSLGRLEGRADALEADIKELYVMVRAGHQPSYTDKKFAKLSIDQKVLQMYEDVKLLAREAGVTLPS